MRKYFKIGFYFSKEIFYYAYALILGNLKLVILVFILNALILYWVTASWLSEIAGIPIQYYIWYVFIAELLMIHYNNPDLTNAVKNGSIIMFLNKPISFIGYFLSSSFFKTLNRILIIWPSVWLILFIFYGNPPWIGLKETWLFIISFLLWVLLLSLIHLLISLSSLVIEDSRFVQFFMNKVYLILWWVFFPIDIYPIWLQNISKYLPFQYFIYSPAKFFTTGDLFFFKSYFPIQVIWVFVILGIVLFSYNKMVKKLEINWG